MHRAVPSWASQTVKCTGWTRHQNSYLMFERVDSFAGNGKRKEHLLSQNELVTILNRPIKNSNPLPKFPRNLPPSLRLCFTEALQRFLSSFHPLILLLFPSHCLFCQKGNKWNHMKSLSSAISYCRGQKKAHSMVSEDKHTIPFLNCPPSHPNRYTESMSFQSTRKRLN